MNKIDAEIIYWSLSMRRNYIETGDINLSAADAVNSKQSAKIRPLATSQMKLIIRIEELMAKCLQRL